MTPAALGAKESLGIVQALDSFGPEVKNVSKFSYLYPASIILFSTVSKFNTSSDLEFSKAL